MSRMSSNDDRRYQVFISSTFKDLQEERQKVLQAVLEMRAFPAGMEMFPSANDEQFDFIKREIESSDYYVVVVAGKYGSLAKDGKSFTEKEHEHATKLGKPTMSFLFYDPEQLKGMQLEADPALRAKLNAFRRQLAAGRLVKYYQNADELKSQVLQALVNAFNNQALQGWVRATNAGGVADPTKESCNQKGTPSLIQRPRIRTILAASAAAVVMLAAGSFYAGRNTGKEITPPTLQIPDVRYSLIFPLGDGDPRRCDVYVVLNSKVVKAEVLSALPEASFAVNDFERSKEIRIFRGAGGIRIDFETLRQRDVVFIMVQQDSKWWVSGASTVPDAEVEMKPVSLKGLQNRGSVAESVGMSKCGKEADDSDRVGS